MQVYVGLKMLAAYFFIPTNRKWSVEWICQSSVANEKQEPLSEEMFQTILTNKKKGLD
jgi:hypothetical protein